MKKLFYLILFLFAFKLQAQPPSKWFNKFGGSGIDIAYSVKETYNKQYIVCGSTTTYGSGAHDAYLLLVDSMGQKVWEKTYGGAVTDIAKAITVNPVDSGFIFTGYTNSIGFGGYDLLVARTDKNGNLLWQKSFGGFDWDFGNDVILAPDGNIVACGYTFNSKFGKTDGYILKVNISNGALIWEKKYGGVEDDVLNSVIKTSDGLFSLCGTRSTNGINNDFWLLKLSINGDSILSKSITSFTTNERCYDFIEDKANELIFCGALDTTVAMTEKYASYALKTDLNGNFISQISYTNGATPDERFHSICNSKNGNTIALSRKIFQNVFKLNCYILKAQNDFNYISSPTYGDYEDDEIFNIEQTSDNGYILAGYTKSYGASSEDVFVIKLDSNVLSASSVIGIKENNNTSTNFNCFYFKNKIHFQNPSTKSTTISIYDISGQLIRNGNTSLDFFETQLKTPGIYFVIINQGEGSHVFKFIVSANND